MRRINKLLLFIVVALTAPAAALAQSPNWSQRGDYYAPERTVTQRVRPQALSQYREGDYYASHDTVVEQPTARHTHRFSEGDYYAPQR